MSAKDKKTAKKQAKKFYLHLVSDATGTTLLGVSRACLAQFKNIEPTQKFWPLIRTQKQLNKVLARIEKNPGLVIFTLVDKDLRGVLQSKCEELEIPCISALDPIIHGLSSYLGVPAQNIPGLQYTMNEDYFRRVDAMAFTMQYDDGQHLDGIEKADIILLGVSRTSKTPTAIYLARRGVKTANIPIIPGIPIPEEALNHKHPLYIGLTEAPERLSNLRKTRLENDGISEFTLVEKNYIDVESIKTEIKDARALFTRHGWPIVDVTKRSIEETSAEILSLLQSKREKDKLANK